MVPESVPSSGPSPAPPARLGLAVAALVLGLISVGLSIVLIGGLVAVVGLVVGILHLMRRPGQPRSMAIVGLLLSLVGLAASVGFGALYYMVMDNVIASMTGGNVAQKWVGKPSPDFTVTTIDGRHFKLSDFKGKRVVVDIWETWCGPCIKEIPHFNQLRGSVSDDDLVLIGISSESESVLHPFQSKHKMAYPIASASDLPAPYSQTYAIPTTFFLDRNGIIQSVLVGYHNFDVLKEHSTAADYEETVPVPPEALTPATIGK